MGKKPKPDSQKQTEQFLMRTSKEFLHKLDEYRRKQDDLPSRSEAIRRLLDSHPDMIHALTDAALSAEAAKKGKKR